MPDQRHPPPCLDQPHDLADRPGVGAGQDRVGVLDEVDELGVEPVQPAQPQLSAEQAEPLVGLIGDRLAEPERLGEGELDVGGEALQGVDSAGERVDRLAAVSDQDFLGVALVVEERAQHGRQVLRFVDHEQVTAQLQPVHLGQLQVNPVVKLELTAGGELEVLPGLAGVGQQVLGEGGGLVGVVGVELGQQVTDVQGGVGGLHELLGHAQGQPGQGGGLDDRAGRAGARFETGAQAEDLGALVGPHVAGAVRRPRRTPGRGRWCSARARPHRRGSCRGRRGPGFC